MMQQLVEIRILLTVDHGIDQLHVGRIRQDVGHLVHHGEAVDDDHLGVAVGEDETVVLFADGRIHRHGDGAYLADGHVEHVPFGAVGQNHGHLVAFLDAQFDEGVTQDIGMFLIGNRTIIHPLPILFASEGHLLVRILLHIVVEKVEDSFDFHF